MDTVPPVVPEDGASPTVSKLAGRLLVTVRARMAVRELCRQQGPVALHMSWPGGVSCLPAQVYEPSEHNVIVAHVAGCPVYADLRQLQLFRDRRVLIDVPDGPDAEVSPLLRIIVAPVRTESYRHRPYRSATRVAAAR